MHKNTGFPFLHHARFNKMLFFSWFTEDLRCIAIGSFTPDPRMDPYSGSLYAQPKPDQVTII
jgi:hypothetical protein